MKSTNIKLYLAMKLMLFLMGSPLLVGQEGYPPNFGYPYSAPEFDCDCDFIAYTQPSQGVLQDDPEDTNFLKKLQGSVTLKQALFQDPVPSGLRAPTFEGQIDLVVDRDTYLLGANPYQVGQGLVGDTGLYYPNADDNFSSIIFVGASDYSQMAKVDLRVAVYLNGSLVKSFIASKSPMNIRLKGNCSQTTQVLYYKEDMVAVAKQKKLKFKFRDTGKYLIRAELVYHDAGQTDVSKLLRTGIAVDVVGNVVRTRTPKTLFVPVVKNRTRGSQLQFYKDKTRILANTFSENLQDYLPIPSRAADYHISPTVIREIHFGDMKDVARKYEKSRRFSNVNTLADRVVVYFEESIFNRLTKASYEDHRNFGIIKTSKGFPISKHVLAMRGMKRTPNFSQPYMRTVVHEDRAITKALLQSLDYPWTPVKNKMGDCKVKPYFDFKRPVAYGIKLRGPNVPQPFVHESEIMGRAIETIGTQESCQCTFRHALKVLSKEKVDPPMVMVSGIARKQDLLTHTAELDPLYQVDGFPELDPQGPGEWRIVLRDGLGQSLASYPFEPAFEVAGFPTKESVFNYTVDAPEDLARVEIWAPRIFIGGPQLALVDALDYSPNKPVIFTFQHQVTPLGDEIMWRGFDWDGDPLRYTLMASEDGLFFTPTVIFESTQSSTYLELPLSVSHLKLIVTDGAQSTERILAL